MQYWNIGGAFSQKELFDKFLVIMGFVRPSDIKFAFYDSPSDLIWQGGRVNIPYNFYDRDFVELIESYNTRDASFHYVFSNELVEKKHLGDKRGNYFLESLHNDKNGVIVSSEVLADYIRKKYPKYKLILSLTKKRDKNPKDWFNKMLDRFDIVVLRPEEANEEFLSQFNDVSRFEVLVNEICKWNCVYKDKHYSMINNANMSGDQNLIKVAQEFCVYNHIQHAKLNIDDLIYMKDCRMTQEHINKLKDIGIRNWKFSARQISPEVVYMDLNKYILEPMGINHIIWSLLKSGVIDKNDHAIFNNIKKVEYMTSLIRENNINL